MEKNHIFSEAASGANSTNAQEPKAREFNNNPFGVEEVDLEQYQSTGPCIYVSTYNAYSSGKLTGSWISLEACADYEEFMKVCRWIARFEAEPEYMFQTADGIPSQFFRESRFTEDDFERALEFAQMDEDEQEAFQSYLDYRCGSYEDNPRVFEDFRDAYCGKFDSEEDFAEQLAEDCGYLAEMPSYLRGYFAFDKFASDLFCTDFYFADNQYVFRCY